MQKFPFTGFDAFLLALEKQYNKKEISGNVCRYMMTLEGEISVQQVSGLIHEHPFALQLFNLKFKKPQPLQIPHWYTRADKLDEISIKSYPSDELIPSEILHKRLSAGTHCLSLDIVPRTNGSVTLILSWNHMLMDGYGAVLLLKRLFGQGKSTEAKHLMSYDTPKFTFGNFWQAVKAKFFIDYSSRLPLSMIGSVGSSIKSEERVKVITFTSDQISLIDQSALKCGARYGRSAFFLACTSRAVKSVLEERGEKIKNFWVPVPRDNRRKGAIGPIIGNRLSFLFYRFKAAELGGIQECVESINRQMKAQISTKMYDSYNHLMNYMKWLPLTLYYHFVRRRGGNSISSFLFTVAADHPNELETVLGHRVTEALSLPANAYPPGLTFAFMNFKDSLKLMILYHTGMISELECRSIEKQITHELTTGTLWEGDDC